MSDPIEHRPIILVIDDDEHVRSTFEWLLAEAGYEVITAENCRKALKKIDETAVDMIFMDIILGKESGIEILREIRKRKMVIPVIMMTEDPDASSASESFDLGAYGHFSKPLTHDRILRLAKLAMWNSGGA